MKTNECVDREERNLQNAELHLNAARQLKRAGGQHTFHVERAMTLTETALSARRKDSRQKRTSNEMKE